jgi:aerobic carbon-monoxide dehydrogenase medium subunit
MIPAAFEYIRATSLDHAVDLLNRDPDGCKLLAGGHTLIPTLKLRLASPSLLVDIRGLSELKGIRIEGDWIRIGALTTHAELHGSEALHGVLPIFRQAADMIADPQVRNRGTIGGSLANADPAADWPAVMIALKAEFDITGTKGSRLVAATDFFIDIFSTALETGDVLTAIHIPRPTAGMRFVYRKIRHPASGYAVVGVAAGLRLVSGTVADISIGVTGAASRAFAADTACAFLTGKQPSGPNIENSARLAAEAITCLSDRYASSEYRAHLVKTEIVRALVSLREAFE